ncbi:MAG: methyltransferase domain-containing protein [Mucilaginibacter polytrichastri]|nr:methyltransferase domain-containing protein [Mucilaginibacter polytrichastri]
MQLHDAIKFLNVPGFDTPQTWADLGCGSGLFTQALAGKLTPESRIYAIDKTPPQAIFTGEKGISIELIVLDFVKDKWPFNMLDGILMANAFHYVKNKAGFLARLKTHLKPAGKLVLVEYDTDVPNPWVPYPLKAEQLKRALESEGFTCGDVVHRQPSVFGHAELYSLAAILN